MRRRRGSLAHWRRAGAVLVLVLAGAGWGCATNPVTGGQDFVLMSEDRELALGRELHPKIVDEYGRYDDPALQAYVQSVGERLAQRGHRPDLVYRFTVLDSPEVNAFALPGGYIYITRGLMAYLQSEAQLAAVLGHELGHVTARHAVRQHSTATVTGVLGTVLAAQAESAAAQDLANVVGTAIVRGYGREMELEADRLGAEYLAAGGYTPQAMLGVLAVLKAQEEFEKAQAQAQGREPRTYHGLFATHPSNDKRLQEAVGAADAAGVAGEPRVGRDRYLDRLEGLVFGDSPAQGIRRGDAFYHPVLDFALHLPAGWHSSNRPERLLARAPGGAAVLEITLHDLNRRVSPRAFMGERLKIRDLARGEPLTANGLEGYTGVTRGRSPFGTRPIRVSVVFFDNRAFVFFGATEAAALPKRFDQAFIDTARSLHRLTEAERERAKPQRLAVVAADAATRYGALAERSPIPNAAEAQLRLLNADYPEGTIAAGERVKVVE